MKRRFTLFSTTALMLCMAVASIAQVPDKPIEKKLMWDYAGIIDGCH